MFHYSKKDNILIISKIPVRKTCTIYQETEIYKSYQHYINYGLIEDIKNYIIPELDKAVHGADTSEEVKIRIEEGRSYVRYDNTSSYRGDEYNSAFISLSLSWCREGTKPFCAFKVPYMDESGVIYKNGKQYALISELVQDDDITFSKGKLKIITKNGYFIQLNEASTGSNIVYRKKNYSPLKVMFALAKKEGLDGEKLFEKLRNVDMVNIYLDRDKLRSDLEYGTDIIEEAGILNSYYSDAYSLIHVRDKMNRVLSIDRALGKSLSRAITLNNGEIIPEETIVTSAILKKIKYSKINEIYVLSVPNMTGTLIGKDVIIRSFRKGTEILPEIERLFSDYDGLYLDKNVELDHPFIIEAGTQVTKALLEVLAYNGVNDVWVKYSENSEKMVHVPFEIEIIGNRHFRECDIGLSKKKSYVYIDESGNISKAKEFITAYDMLAMISLFNRLVKNCDLEVIASRDVGLRKKINMTEELFHKAFLLAAPDFIKTVKKTFINMYENAKNDFDKPDKMEAKFFVLAEKWWSKLMLNLKVIQTVDRTNPVAYYSSLSKINTIIADSNAITEDMRWLSMGHYGRLCPYEIPSGKKLGVVNNRAMMCKIEKGIMKTPYYEVKHIGDESYITGSIVYLAVEEEENYRIADITSLRVDEKGKILNKERVLARIPTTSGLEKMSVLYVDILKIDLVNIDPQQSISLACSTIPFQGADDSARVTFEISMAKQAKGLLNPEVPIVLTSAFIDIPRQSPYFMVQAEYDGEVVDIVDGMVTMYYYELNDTKSYMFKQREFSNTSVIIRTIEVEQGQMVKAGDVLISSNYVKEGFLATGINALVCYVPEGYNYEDGVFASHRLKHKLTSYGANYESEIIPKVYMRTTVNAIDKFKYQQKDNIIYKTTHLTKSKFITRVIKSKKLKGFMVDVTKDVDKYSKKDKATTAYAVSFDYIKQGDKIANRHGNKGVAPELRSNTEMPMFKNGEFVDLCYNPAGVSSRMNIGQILECNLGLAGYILGVRMRSDSFNGASIREIKMLLSYAWHLANDDDENIVNKMFPELPSEFKEVCMKNLIWIRAWKNSFNEDGTAWMLNPRTGKYFETPVVVGINYIYKLIHEVTKKMHARGGFVTEPYVEKTSAPTHGSAKLGGQRFGEMELDALAAYGASAFMQELMNGRGDNPVARNNLTVNAMHKGSNYLLDEKTGIRRSTEEFVNRMEALGVKIEFEGELPNNTKIENEKRIAYTAKTLVMVRDVGKEKKAGKLKSFDAFSTSLIE